MAERKPLVLVNGRKKMLPAGDTTRAMPFNGTYGNFTVSGINGDFWEAATGSITLNKIAPITDQFFLANNYGYTESPGAVSPATVKTMLALHLVDNTSDVNKPVSAAQQAALNLKANLAGPTLTGLVRFGDNYVSAINGNTLNGGFGTNALADMWLNYRGYNDGFTQFRDLRIGDGKGAQVAVFQGSDKSLQLAGGLTVALGSTFSGLLIASQIGAATEAIRVSNTTDGKRLHLSSGTAGAKVQSQNSDLIFDAFDVGTSIHLQTQGVTRVQLSSTSLLAPVDITNYRAAAPTTGYHYFGNTGGRYIGYDGTNWVVNVATGQGNIWHTQNFDPATKLGVSAKAADSELLDGIDSTRVVFGDNNTATSNVVDMNAPLKSGFYQRSPGAGVQNSANGADSWNWFLHHQHTNNSYGFQLSNIIGSNDLYVRGQSGGVWAAWNKLYTTGSGNIAHAAQISADSLTTANAAGTYINGNNSGLQMVGVWYENGTTYNLAANGAVWVRNPRHFVQSTDPGAQASDGDVWTNTA